MAEKELPPPDDPDYGTDDNPDDPEDSDSDESTSELAKRYKNGVSSVAKGEQ